MAMTSYGLHLSLVSLQSLGLPIWKKPQLIKKVVQTCP